jgi:hypothetical protein
MKPAVRAGGNAMCEQPSTAALEEQTQAATRNGASSADAALDEAVLDEWRWFAARRAEGAMDQYAGQYVAVQDRKVWEAGRDPELLEKYAVRQHGLDPRRLVIAYVDRF